MGSPETAAPGRFETVAYRPEADFRLGDVFYLRAFRAAYLASEGDGVEFNRVQEYAAGHAGGMSS